MRCFYMTLLFTSIKVDVFLVIIELTENKIFFIDRYIIIIVIIL